MKGNPISDRRLLKLIEQCRTKQILEYVKQHSEKKSLPKENISRRKNRNKSKTEHADDDNEYKYTIIVKSSLPNFKVFRNVFIIYQII